MSTTFYYLFDIGLKRYFANICNYGIRACALCPGEVSTAILDKRPKKLSIEQKNKMLQPDDLGETIAFLCEMPKHVCINELTISPTWHRRYIAELGIEAL